VTKQSIKSDHTPNPSLDKASFAQLYHFSCSVISLICYLVGFRCWNSKAAKHILNKSMMLQHDGETNK